MRRSILLVLVAALALAVGLSSLATAGQGGVGTSAKRAHKKAKKKNGCKSKGKKKGKRAHRSAAASKAKGKKKGKGCKSAAGRLPVGEYRSNEGIGLQVKSGGKRAGLIVNGASGTCLPVPLEFPDEPVTSTGKSFKAGGKTIPLFGGHGSGRWMIEITPQFRYKLTLDTSYDLPGQAPCDAPGARFSGTLSKID